MLIPIEYLVRQQLLAAGTYSFVVENLLTVRFAVDCALTFHNPFSSSSSIQINYTVAQSGVFSDTYDVADEVVVIDSVYTYQFKVPLVRTNSYKSHAVTMTNLGATTRGFIVC